MTETATPTAGEQKPRRRGRREPQVEEVTLQEAAAPAEQLETPEAEADQD